MTTTTKHPPHGGTPPGPRHASLEPYDVFVTGVRAACGDPGTQQALRRGLAKPVDEVPARTHAALLRGGLVPDDVRGSRRRAYYAVAALIAARPRAQRLADADAATGTDTDADADADTVDGSGSTRAGAPGGTSLGESLALAVVRQGPDGVKEEGVESRLHLMVRQDVDGIHRMLPGVLRQLGSAGIAADYGCLLRDLTAWDRYRDSVATRWLEHYYRTLRRERAAAARRGSPTADTDKGSDPGPSAE
ncbi:type I-E CRISPR-associated protein Cse2/CasB [Peterkaempfera bronchialis]|uniref:Type I-E CRISPR-associated protein Cse2/CasB n=1 Tax=Peterkaempfera bronchialis TaxID=2126346 RepID=A0A345T1F9_9ACTN|nr:type I-E CRISPR-associated protein Cse2/CasB [Peterkaempfera bronchialis]AXI79814.1 type I-E CRISPR-associated protein Cse2/CasB [Peterkaempfera bronchialis]